MTTQQPGSLEAYRAGLEPPPEWRDSWWKQKLLALTGFYARKTQLTTGAAAGPQRPLAPLPRRRRRLLRPPGHACARPRRRLNPTRPRPAA